jgi:hypothetical protein
VLIAVAAVVVRRGRARRWRPGRALTDVVRASRRTSAEEAAVGDGPDDGRVGDTRPDLSQLDDVRAAAHLERAAARRRQPPLTASEESDFVMTIANGGGTLQAGSTAAITVTITPEGLGNSQAGTAPYVTVNPGGATVSFTVSLPCTFCG